MPDQGFGADPFVLLGEIARSTTIPLGLGLTSPMARHPAHIARAISTLVGLYPDRDWVFALGLADPDRVLRPLRIEVRRGPAQLAAAVRSIRRLLAGERETLDDPELMFAADGIQLGIETAGPVRLYVGSRGPRVLRHAAGAEADGVLADSLFTPEAISWTRERLDLGSMAEGRGAYDRPHVAWQRIEVLEPGAEPSEATRRHAAAQLVDSVPELLDRLGVAPELVGRLSVPGGVDPQQLPAAEVARFVAAQTADELIETVSRAAGAGVTAWCSVVAGDHIAQLQQARRFAEGVIHRYR